MRRVRFLLVLSFATACQFDSEEAARNHREWLYEPDHINDPVVFHASEQPEFLDPPGPEPIFGPRRDPDTIPRERPSHEAVPLPAGLDLEQW
jgi:hypothetical protein